VTGSLFNEEEVEQPLIMPIKFIKISFLHQIRNGYCGSAAGTSKSVVRAVLTNMTVQQASSQQLLFPLDLFFSATEMELIKI
jgi:DNA mismatch repair protein MutL